MSFNWKLYKPSLEYNKEKTLTDLVHYDVDQKRFGTVASL